MSRTVSTVVSLDSGAIEVRLHSPGGGLGFELDLAEALQLRDQLGSALFALATIDRPESKIEVKLEGGHGK